MRLLHRLWQDERGVIATTDLVLLATIVVLGLIVGLVEYRNQVVQEFADLGQAVGHLNQSYTYEGTSFTFTFTTGDTRTYTSLGSSFTDQKDFGDGEETEGQPPPGITVSQDAGSPATNLESTTPTLTP